MTKAAVLDIHPGDEYNDIWGYTDAQGNDFAIVGSEGHINIVIQHGIRMKNFLRFNKNTRSEILFSRSTNS